MLHNGVQETLYASTLIMQIGKRLLRFYSSLSTVDFSTACLSGRGEALLML